MCSDFLTAFAYPTSPPKSECGKCYGLLLNMEEIVNMSMKKHSQQVWNTCVRISCSFLLLRGKYSFIRGHANWLLTTA